MIDGSKFILLCPHAYGKIEIRLMLYLWAKFSGPKPYIVLIVGLNLCP